MEFGGKAFLKYQPEPQYQHKCFPQIEHSGPKGPWVKLVTHLNGNRLQKQMFPYAVNTPIKTDM